VLGFLYSFLMTRAGKNFMRQVLWIHNGKIHDYGKPQEVVKKCKQFSENKR